LAESLVRWETQLGVLEKNFNTIYGYFPLLVEILILLALIFYTFLGVVTGSLGSFIYVLLYSVLFVRFFRRLARVYETSLEAIQSWRGNRKWPL
jgi:hypothetical protein